MSANERQTVDSALELRARFHGIFGESESSQLLSELWSWGISQVPVNFTKSQRDAQQRTNLTRSDDLVTTCESGSWATWEAFTGRWHEAGGISVDYILFAE